MASEHTHHRSDDDLTLEELVLKKHTEAKTICELTFVKKPSTAATVWALLGIIVLTLGGIGGVVAYAVNTSSKLSAHDIMFINQDKAILEIQNQRKQDVEERRAQHSESMQYLKQIYDNQKKR